jgi:peptidoglycan/LPS O-acetylase OafA/YrhL
MCSQLIPFLLAFDARRVKRLLPLLIVCVLLTSGVGALLGTGNLVLQARQADDFASCTDLNLFTQTWSPGVGEPF